MRNRVFPFVLFLLPFLVAPQSFAEHLVEYRVKGSAAVVTVTFRDANGSTRQQPGVTPPWSFTFRSSSESFVYLSAQDDRTGIGALLGDAGWSSPLSTQLDTGAISVGGSATEEPLTVTIIVDGVPWQTRTVGGIGESATVFGVLP